MFQPRLVTYQDTTLSLRGWAEHLPHLHLTHQSLRHRLVTLGWSIEEALTRPVVSYPRAGVSPWRHTAASSPVSGPNLLACCEQWHEITEMPLTVACCGRTYFAQEGASHAL